MMRLRDVERWRGRSAAAGVGLKLATDVTGRRCVVMLGNQRAKPTRWLLPVLWAFHHPEERYQTLQVLGLSPSSCGRGLERFQPRCGPDQHKKAHPGAVSDLMLLILHSLYPIVIIMRFKRNLSS